MKSSGTWYGVVGVVFIATVFGVVGFVAYLLYGPPISYWPFGNSQQTSLQATSTESSATSNITGVDLSGEEGALFTCEGSKSLKADFAETGVRLALFDGRHISLPQVVSASGTRYANPDESFVFWNSGNTAFIGENGMVTYATCVGAGE